MDSPTGTEKTPARPAIHFPALALLLLSLSPVCAFLPAPCAALEDTKKEAPTFGLTGGQVLIGELEEKDISIATSYGRLSVPFSEILRVRFAPRLSNGDVPFVRAQLMGEHTDDVLRSDLALESAEIAELRDAGVVA